MSNQNCIFCKIIHGIIPSKKIYETNDILVIQDIAPQAPIHYLIIPKKHFSTIAHAQLDDQALLGSLLLTAKELATKLPQPQDFRLVSNNGASVGQSVHHVHIHFLAGMYFSDTK